MVNTIIYQQDWEVKLQERLDADLNWKDVLDVTYTNTRVLNAPYIATSSEPVVQTGTRGTTYAFQDITEVSETITISSRAELPVFIDDADEAQSNYAKQMNIADLQGTLMNEKIESLFLAQHADWTNFGDTGGGALGLASTQITVNANNIDDIIRGVKREVIKANGLSLAMRNGICFLWRATDWELLELLMQTNGFATADMALRDGIVPKVNYMGAQHYVMANNLLTANHVFAAVKKTYALGILKATAGKMTQVIHPAGASGGNLAGMGLYTAYDYAFKAWTKLLPVMFDVNVA